MKKGIVILFALLTLLSLAVLVACDNVGKEEVTYTVTFMDGDEVCYTREVGENTAVLYKPDEEAGRTFVGWFTDRELTEPFDGSRGVSADTTVYGKWDTEVFTVKFVDADGNILKEMTVEYGCDAVPPAEEEVPVPEGYEFQGWSDPYTHITSDMVIAAEYEKIPGKGNLVFFINDEEIYSVTDVTEGDPIGRYINEANAEVPKKLPGYVQFGSVWTDEEGNSVSSDAVFGGKDTALYAELSFAESLDINRHDITAAQSGDDDFDFAPRYMENFMGALGYSLSGTAYKDVDYTFTWYYNGDVLNAADFDDNSGLKLEAHSLNFGTGDSLYFANAATEGAVGALQFKQWKVTLNVGEYSGLFALKMTATPNENSGFRYLGSYERELKWDFKVIPAEFSLEYNYELKSSVYGEEGYADKVTSDNIFGKGVLKEGDKVTFSVDGENYSDEVHLKDAGVYSVAFKVSRFNYEDFTRLVIYEITPKPITVYAAIPENRKFYYGDTPSYDGVGYFAEGLLEGDELDISEAEFGGFPASFGAAGQNYTVYFDGGVKNDNYKIEYGTDPLEDGKNIVTISKRPVSITVEDAEVEYGAQLPAFIPKLYEGAGSMGFAPGEDFGNLVSPKSYTVVGWKSVGKNNVGEYRVTPDYSNYDGNYHINTVAGTLKVIPKAITGYISDKETAYGSNAGVKFSVTYPELAGMSDYENEVTYISDAYEYTFEISKEYDVKTAHAGASFSVTGSAAFKEGYGYSENYEITLESGTLTVTKAEVTVSVTKKPEAEEKLFTYGKATAENIAGSYSLTATPFANGENHLSNFEVITDYAAGMNAGTYSVLARQTAELTDYEVIIQKTEIEVSKSPLKVWLIGNSIYYGEVAQLSVGYSGEQLYYGDKLEATNVSWGNYEAGDAAGSYTVTADITINGVEPVNYEIEGADDFKLEVKPREVVFEINETTNLTAGERWGKSFNNVDNLYESDTVSATFTLDTFAAGTHVYENGEGADGWGINVTFERDGVDVTANYEISYKLSVTILSITVEHNLSLDGGDAEKGQFDFVIGYDSLEHSVEVTPVAEGYTVSYYAGEEAPENAEYDTAVPKFHDAGTYTVHYRLTPNNGGDAESGSFTLTIEKAELEVTLDKNAITIEYGEEFAGVEVKYTPEEGLLKGDDSFTLNFTSSYKAGSDVGEYDLAIECKSESDPYNNYSNYSVIFNGKLTVNPRKIEIEVAPVTVIYGEAATLTYKVTSGSLYGGDKLYPYSDYAPGKKAGSSYPILVRGNSNYDVTYSNADKAIVTVDKRKLNVVISDITIKYGEVPEYKFEVSNLWYGDEGKIIPEAVSDYYDTANPNSFGDKGEYDIKLSTTTLENYTVPENAKGKLTVEPLDITVKWLQVESDFTYNGKKQEVDITYANLDGTVQAVIESAVISLSYKKDGEDAEFIDAGLYTVTLSLGSNFNVRNPKCEFEIAKAEYKIPEEFQKIEVIYRHDSTLSAIEEPTDLSWLNPNEVPVPGKKEYEAVVTNENYFSHETIKVPVTVSKAEIRPDSVYTLEYVSGGVTLPASVPAVYDDGAALPRDAVAFKFDKTEFDAPGTYKVTATGIEENDYYKISENSENLKVYVKVAAVSLKGTKYTLEDALFNAEWGDTITLPNDVDLTFATGDAAGCYGKDDAYRTVKAGVTLILPSTKDSGGKGEATYLGTKDSPHTERRYIDTIDSLINMKLTVPENVNFIINGTVIVRGGMGSTSIGTNGHTSDNHSQIINNGSVTVKGGGTLDLRGFIKGKGELSMEDGSDLYAPFVVVDFRGGTSTVLTYRKGKIAPFNVFDFPNMQCKVTYEYGSELKVYCDLYANDEHCSMEPLTILGPDDEEFLFGMKEGSKIVYTSYDDGFALPEATKSGYSGYPTTLKHSVQLLGNINVGSLKLKISLTIISSEVDMGTVLSPVSYLYDIIIGDGNTLTTVTSNGRWKFLPGSSLTLKDNATLNVGGELIFYEEFPDAFKGNADGKNTFVSYPALLAKEAADLKIEGGTMSVTGALGAKVEITGSGTLTVSSGARTTLTSEEGDSGDSKPLEAIFNTGKVVVRYTANIASRLSDGTAIKAGNSYDAKGLKTA